MFKRFFMHLSMTPFYNAVIKTLGTFFILLNIQCNNKYDIKVQTRLLGIDMNLIAKCINALYFILMLFDRFSYLNFDINYTGHTLENPVHKRLIYNIHLKKQTNVIQRPNIILLFS